MSNKQKNKKDDGPEPSASLRANRFTDASYVRNFWSVSAEVGTTKQDMMKPEYWAHVANMLKPCDRLEVQVEDGSYFAEFIVRTCGNTWATVSLINERKLQDVESPKEAVQFEAQWKGASLKWCVVRLSDKQNIHEGAASEQEAMTWMQDYEKAIAA